MDLGFSRHLEEGVASTVCGTPITMARISWLQDSRAKQRATITKLIFGPWVRLPMNCLLDEFPSMRVVIICLRRKYWDKIKAHPFIVNDVDNFHFIDLHNVGDINDEYLEMNTKNCDNYLWLNYKNATFNMALDKVNEEVIKKPEMNKIIK